MIQSMTNQENKQDPRLEGKFWVKVANMEKAIELSDAKSQTTFSAFFQNQDGEWIVCWEPTKMSKMNHTKPINTPDEAKEYLKTLHDNNLLFHLDDDPEDMISTVSGEPTFTKEEVPLVRERVKEVFQQLKDPFEYIIDVLEK